MPRFRSTAAATAAVLTLAACADTVVTRGYQIDQRRVTEVRPGVTTKPEVARIMGTPSTLATFDDQSWYYVSQRYNRANFFAETQTAQDVVVVRFDDKGVVSDIVQRDLADALAIQPDPEVTRTLGNDLSLVREFIGNIGRFNTDGSAPSSFDRQRGPSGL